MAIDLTAGRLMRWLNDPEEPLWERPRPTRDGLRRDIVGAAIYLAGALALLTASQSLGVRVEEDTPLWRAYVATVVMVAPLAVRRRFPVTVLLAASVLFFAMSFVSMDAYIAVPFQAAYFGAMYAAVAWAPDRRVLWGAITLVLFGMTLWIVISYTTVASFETFFGSELDPSGPLSQLTASVVYDAMVNAAFFGGAIFAGRTGWRSALQRERLVVQADHIRGQSAELARRAVVDERLRIARELHDVVAHHVAVIGIQAGAARRLLDRDREAAVEALRTVEGASRQAVGEMRSLLGVLREEDAPVGGETRAAPGADGGPAAAPSRSPEPGLGDVPALVAEFGDSLDVELRRAEGSPGDLDQIPDALGLSLYRTVQESLTNVLRHSTASRALITLRTGRDEGVRDAGPPGWVEVEVVDAGRPRADSGGSGFGLRGIRERVALHGGEAEIGPRRTGDGWRVRARFPLPGVLPAVFDPDDRSAPAPLAGRQPTDLPSTGARPAEASSGKEGRA